MLQKDNLSVSFPCLDDRVETANACAALEKGFFFLAAIIEN